MSIFTKIGTFLHNLFNNVKDKVDKVAIAITEAVKTGITSGVIPALADDVLGVNLGTQVTAVATKAVNAALAVELGLQGLPDNATAEELEAFSTSVVTAVAGLGAAQKSQLWTTLAAQVYQAIDTEVNASEAKTLTFAQIVGIVETAYQDYVADEASTAAATQSNG